MALHHRGLGLSGHQTAGTDVLFEAPYAVLCNNDPRTWHRPHVAGSL